MSTQTETNIHFIRPTIQRLHSVQYTASVVVSIITPLLLQLNINIYLYLYNYLPNEIIYNRSETIAHAIWGGS